MSIISIFKIYLISRNKAPKNDSLLVVNSAGIGDLLLIIPMLLNVFGKYKRVDILSTERSYDFTKILKVFNNFYYYDSFKDIDLKMYGEILSVRSK